MSTCWSTRGYVGVLRLNKQAYVPPSNLQPRCQSSPPPTSAKRTSSHVRARDTWNLPQSLLSSQHPRSPMVLPVPGCFTACLLGKVRFSCQARGRDDQWLCWHVNLTGKGRCWGAVSLLSWSLDGTWINPAGEGRGKLCGLVDYVYITGCI